MAVSLDNYAKTTDLINAMKSTPTTDGWDIVVSYSLSRLNEQIIKIWKERPQSTVTLKTSFPNLIDPNGPKTPIVATLTLGQPELRFTRTKRASLNMPISGHYIFQTGSNPQTTINPDIFSLELEVPISLVKAKLEEGILPTQNTSDRISFNANDTEAAHIVMDFRTGVKDHSSKIIGDDDKNPGVKQILDLIAADINDPGKFSGLRQSLAIVTNQGDPSVTYLIPEEVEFKIFVPEKQNNEFPDVGCLSVYIKIKNSDQLFGGDQRVHNQPFKIGGVETYPISKEHNASIILRYELWEHYLSDTLTNMKRNGANAFKKVVKAPTMTDKQLNFEATPDAFDLNVPGTGMITVHFHDIEIPGITDTGSYTWKYTEVPVKFSVDYYGKGKWDYENSMSKDVTALFPVSNVLVGGKATITGTISIKKETSIFSKASNHELDAHCELDSEDWITDVSVQGWKVGPAEAGAGEARELREALANATFAHGEKDLRLDYFTSTNIFAPGKEDKAIISIDSTSDVYTPHDVVLFGHMIQKPTS